MSSLKFTDTGGTVQSLRLTCHDMRQPVAGVLALAAAALAEPELPRPVRTRIEQITEQAELLAAMIAQWLRAQEPGDGCPRADLVRIANEAAAAERLTWGGELTVGCLAGPAQAAVEPVAARRIIGNLLSNATRAAGPSGTVRIEVGRSGDGSRVVVEDSGPGFGRIWEGHGLGLTSVATQVARYRGRFESGRAALGGLRMTVWLPLRPDSRQSGESGPGAGQ